MLKKTLFVGVAAALALGLLLGSNTVGYLGTMAGNVKEAINDKIPMEVKIETARKEVSNLRNVINDQIHQIAKEEVEVEKLESQLATRQSHLQDAQAHILRLKNHLETSSDQFVYDNVTYSQAAVEKNLRSRFESYKVANDTVNQMAEIVRARRSGLDAANQELNELRAAKADMEVQIENLVARHNMLEVKKTASQFNFDDSKLAHCRKMLEDIDTKLRIEDRIVNTVESEVSEIPLELPEKANGNVLDEVNDFFTTNQDL